MLICACLELSIFTSGSVKFEWAVIDCPAAAACQRWSANLFTTDSDSFHVLPSTRWLALADGRLRPQHAFSVGTGKDSIIDSHLCSAFWHFASAYLISIAVLHIFAANLKRVDFAT
jgi:hypothetical protein